MKNPNDIPNFERLSKMMEASDKEPDNLGIIQEMMAIEGYSRWLEWMEENRPEKLP